jgi:prevent-host-death family protein
MPVKEVSLAGVGKNLSALLDQAIRDQPSIVTRHGRACVALVPVHHLRLGQGPSFLSLRGPWKGLGMQSANRAVVALRGKWD